MVGQKKTLTNPVAEREDRAGTPGSVTGRIMPVYPLSAGLTQRVVLDAVRAALDACSGLLPDALPEEILQRYGLAQAGFAYENIHFPADMGSLELARRRLIFEELFVLACAMQRIRGQREKTGDSKCSPGTMRNFTVRSPSHLPALRNERRRAPRQTSAPARP